MDEIRLLSGDELVSRGTTKINSALPEVGLKDVLPTGSWLEKKQIQSAIDARKHIIEVERIEKSGVLSEAVWCEKLMLADVTKKAGGHWQYLGHNVGKTLFLRPEEALFLMETNCLHLKHNDVTVSLQQAYSLLLRSTVSILQYKVYASLSRLGYKVYISNLRKSVTEIGNDFKSSLKQENAMGVEDPIKSVKENSLKIDEDSSKNSEVTECGELSTNVECSNAINNDKGPSECSQDENMEEVNKLGDITDKINVGNNDMEHDGVGENYTSLSGNITKNNDNKTLVSQTTSRSMKSENNNCQTVDAFVANRNQLLKLTNRQMKQCNTDVVHRTFNQIPDLSNNQSVTITVPDEQYLPRNIFLNNLNYTLNLKSISAETKNSRSESTEARPYSVNEEVNGEHVRRIRDNQPSVNWTPPNTNPRFLLQNRFRPQIFWRPNINHTFNMFFQRPFMFNMNYINRFHPFLRPNFAPRYPNLQMNTTNQINMSNLNRKRKRNQEKQVHLEAIKNLAQRLKVLVNSGSSQEQNITALTTLIRTFNVRYNATLRLSETFEVHEIEIETISLEDEDETTRKKSKPDNYDENLNTLKTLAAKLKQMELENKAGSRHRRAFSNLVKKFNKNYKAEIYATSNYEILDKRCITLDSSSDSDCVVEETPKVSIKKKLKNPFNILKKLSEKQNNVSVPLPALDATNKRTNYSTLLTIFGENWLPKEDDFGTAEIPLQNLAMINAKTDEFLFDFIKSQPIQFSSWLDVKIAFLKSCEETSKMIQSEDIKYPEINSIIKPEDCTDTASVLKKLSIIKSNVEIDDNCNLIVDFDVYNRDVQNFRKSNRPKPHFRVICISESSRFPSGKEIATMHERNSDVPVVFAVVGIGSISYLQINPTNLPIYIPNNDLT